MNAPLYEALAALAEKGEVRMHMPGHKGRAMTPLFSAAAIDYTEIPPTGNLYTGEGPIAEAEALAAAAWGAPGAYFLTGGSTQGVLAGLALCAAPGETILLDRNAHKSFFSAAALLDLRPVYLCGPTAEGVSAALAAHPEIKTVCLTSPTYDGRILDIPAIAAACRASGARLFVDGAHGAHFPFVGRGGCAVALGADASVCSAHKTLPALGSAAVLFTSGDFSAAEVRSRTALFGTSSPSYPVMASIDWARAYLEGEGGARYREAAARTAALRRAVNRRGVFHALTEEDGLTLDPTRLTVDTARAGLDGRKAGELLEQTFHIWPEMDDRRGVVCILTCADGAEEFARLEEAFQKLEAFAGGAPLPPCPPPPAPEICRTVRQAIFGPRCRLPLGQARGRIAAASIAPYPPGVPVAAPGERITGEILDYFKTIGYPLDEPVFVLEEGA